MVGVKQPVVRHNRVIRPACAAFLGLLGFGGNRFDDLSGFANFLACTLSLLFSILLCICSTLHRFRNVTCRFILRFSVFLALFSELSHAVGAAIAALLVVVPVM